MSSLSEIGPAFLKMAHEIVWCSVATVDRKSRPRSRVLHPVWKWDGDKLVGWVGTGPTPLKRAHLANSPHVSVNYWAPSQDNCTAECRAELLYDAETREMVWDLLKNAPAPVGYDPTIIPGWEDASSEGFAALRLDPWRLRVFPGSVLLGQGGEVLTWNE